MPPNYRSEFLKAAKACALNNKKPIDRIKLWWRKVRASLIGRG